MGEGLGGERGERQRLRARGRDGRVPVAYLRAAQRPQVEAAAAKTLRRTGEGGLAPRSRGRQAQKEAREDDRVSARRVGPSVVGESDDELVEREGGLRAPVVEGHSGAIGQRTPGDPRPRRRRFERLRGPRLPRASAAASPPARESRAPEGARGGASVRERSRSGGNPSNRALVQAIRRGWTPSAARDGRSYHDPPDWLFLVL